MPCSYTRKKKLNYCANDLKTALDLIHNETMAVSLVDHLHQILSNLNLFDRPESIYNVDELAFGHDPCRKYVIIKRASKYATCAQGGSGKSYTTLLMCTSAAGKFLPPYIIYQALRLFDVWMPRNCFLGSRFNATQSGWSEEKTFFDWLCNHFVPSISTLFKNHLLPAHCSGGFSKTGIYPFDKRAISKEKLLQPVATVESNSNPSTYQSNTTDFVSDKATSSTDISTLRRSSSCPNISSNDLSSISSNTSSLNNDNLITNSTNISTSPVYTSNQQDLSSTNDMSPIAAIDTRTSSIFSDTLMALYSEFDEPVFEESIYSQDQPSSKASVDSLKADHSGLDAITTAINNHTKPTIITTNKRKRQIDRPYGESVTSVEAYVKSSTENELSIDSNMNFQYGVQMALPYTSNKPEQQQYMNTSYPSSINTKLLIYTNMFKYNTNNDSHSCFFQRQDKHLL
ncbi:unnamed protein product [Rotaria magnacalcarata]|uniref:DDE-1 domain-containing protein n=1 Tax=Rotaria magnacalcarata TaxID=392030 RepID=A0A819JGV5_9BILA|nr:unnamed protein product [Rotaria magnacalcarata]CAF2102216.1 unnamed protein product [Rotaria magnacalcarata]CAF3856399.1 unnamed protein product [Rotaria magnacalcarata]CAF3932663.1 unnamed protein product [Rotaria magnacalcarata]